MLAAFRDPGKRRAEVVVADGSIAAIRLAVRSILGLLFGWRVFGLREPALFGLFWLRRLGGKCRHVVERFQRTEFPIRSNGQLLCPRQRSTTRNQLHRTDTTKCYWADCSFVSQCLTLDSFHQWFVVATCVIVMCSSFVHETNDAVRQNRISISRVHSSILRIAELSRARFGLVRFGSRVLEI